MPDLRGRDKHEAELAAGVAVVFAAQRQKLSGLLGAGGFRATITSDVWLQFTQDTAARLKAPLAATYYRSGAQLGAGVGSEALYGDATRWASQAAHRLASQVTLTTSVRVQVGMQQASAAAAKAFSDPLNWSKAGDHASAASKAFEIATEELDKALATAFSPARIERIAVTETTGAAVAGQEGVVDRIQRKTGLVITSLWHTEEDEKVCPLCRPMNEQPRSVWTRYYPFGPPAHGNCRCWIDYDDLPDLGGDENEGDDLPSF